MCCIRKMGSTQIVLWRMQAAVLICWCESFFPFFVVVEFLWTATVRDMWSVTVGHIISPWQKFAILSSISEYLSKIHPMLFHYILCILNHCTATNKQFFAVHWCNIIRMANCCRGEIMLPTVPWQKGWFFQAILYGVFVVLHHRRNNMNGEARLLPRCCTHCHLVSGSWRQRHTDGGSTWWTCGRWELDGPIGPLDAWLECWHALMVACFRNEADRFCCKKAVQDSGAGTY